MTSKMNNRLSVDKGPESAPFDPPLGRICLVEGIFPLELTWVLSPFPQNSFGWECRPRSSLCTCAFHRTDSKDPDVHVLDGWMLATKTHPACTIHEDGMWLPQWLDLRKGSHMQKSHPKQRTPELAGNAEEVHGFSVLGSKHSSSD